MMSRDLPRVEAYLEALHEQALLKDDKAQGSVLWYIAFYQSRAPNRRRAFRIAGFILLFLSISLPFLTQLAPDGSKAMVASVLSWFIALVAAASSFFNWQKSWQLFMQAQMTLQFALSEWQLKTAEARSAATDEEGLQILKDALQTLTRTVNEAVASETAQYFEGVKAPDVHARAGS
jgi:hypothetical protein